MPLLLFWQPKLLPPPRFKVCKRCGAICESAINRCPGLISINKISFWERFWRRLLRKPKYGEFFFICESVDFQEVTCSIAKQGVKIYFQTWPTWPDERAWRQISAKDDMEKSSRTKKPTD